MIDHRGSQTRHQQKSWSARVAEDFWLATTSRWKIRDLPSYFERIMPLMIWIWLGLCLEMANDAGSLISIHCDAQSLPPLTIPSWFLRRLLSKAKRLETVMHHGYTTSWVNHGGYAVINHWQRRKCDKRPVEYRHLDMPPATHHQLDHHESPVGSLHGESCASSEWWSALLEDWF